MNKKITFCFWFVFIFAISIIVQGILPGKCYSSSFDDLGPVYENQKYHFAIQFPKNWGILEEKDVQRLFEHTDAVVGAKSDSGSIILISISKPNLGLPITTSIENFYSSSVEFASSFDKPDRTIWDYGKIYIGGQPAYWLESSSGSIFNTIFGFVKSRRYYLIVLHSYSEKEFLDLQPVLFKSVKTFKFL